MAALHSVFVWPAMLEISRPETAVPLEGRPPCRPILAERSSAPIRPTRPRWRAGKMGADGASPSKGFEGRRRADCAFVAPFVPNGRDGAPPPSQDSGAKRRPWSVDGLGRWFANSNVSSRQGRLPPQKWHDTEVISPSIDWRFRAARAADFPLFQQRLQKPADSLGLEAAEGEW